MKTLLGNQYKKLRRKHKRIRRRGFYQLSYLKNRIRFGHREIKSPVFIVGCGHSGTSLLLAIIGSHPNLYPIPYESAFAREDQAEFRSKELKCFDRMALASNKERWVEKTPRHIHNIDSILKSFPDAHILLVVRDGRDVACSIRDRRGDLESGAKRWVLDNFAGKKWWNHKQVMIVKYEDIIQNFQLAIAEVLNFLGEEYHDDLEAFSQSPKRWYANTIEKPSSAFGRNHAQYRNWQINQPLFDGRGRWKKLEKGDLQRLEHELEPLLTELGYKKSLE